MMWERRHTWSGANFLWHYSNWQSGLSMEFASKMCRFLVGLHNVHPAYKLVNAGRACVFAICFSCPGIERSGAYSFWPVRLSVCLQKFNISHIV
jgi:hypothetical protein